MDTMRCFSTSALPRQNQQGPLGWGGLWRLVEPVGSVCVCVWGVCVCVCVRCENKINHVQHIQLNTMLYNNTKQKAKKAITWYTHHTCTIEQTLEYMCHTLHLLHQSVLFSVLAFPPSSNGLGIKEETPTSSVTLIGWRVTRGGLTVYVLWIEING